MNENRDHDHNVKEKTDTSMSLETVIAMGLFGWIAQEIVCLDA